MKKNILFLTLTLLATTGCTKTWSGIKQDTYNAVSNTKEVIHDATAPDPIIEDVPEVKPLPNLDTLGTAKERAIKSQSTTIKKTVSNLSKADVEQVKSLSNLNSDNNIEKEVVKAQVVVKQSPAIEPVI